MTLEEAAACSTRTRQQRNWRKSNTTTASTAKRPALRPSTKPAHCWWELSAAPTTKHGAAPPRTAPRSTLYPSTKSKRFSMTSGAANGKQRRRPESASCACRTPWTTARRWWPWTIPPATPGRRILQAFRRRWNGSTGRIKSKWTGFVDF